MNKKSRKIKKWLRWATVTKTGVLRYTDRSKSYALAIKYPDDKVIRVEIREIKEK